MTVGRELEIILIQSSGERPLRGSLRNIFYGTSAAIILTLVNVLLNGAPWKGFIGYLLMGSGISFFGWGAERLWYSTISPMVDNPFSWYAYLSRIPFWHVAGGIGFTLGMLLAKKIGVLEVNDIPVKRLFDFGGLIECGIQVPLQIMLYRALLKRKHQ